jgi:transcriptional regulator with XRE-family HTH domain
MKIGEVIVNLRKQKGVKQKDLAVSVGISATYLSLIEHNEQKPSIDVIAKIAGYFDLPVTSLLFMAMNFDDLKNKEQQKYFRAAKPIIDSLIEYLLSDNSTSKGKDRLARVRQNLKSRKVPD